MSYIVLQYPVSLALKKILNEKSSGELIVMGEGFKKNLFFKDSNLVFAKTNVIQERLGEILFKIGKIDRTQFININKFIEGKNEKLGEILIQNNIINQQDLSSALLYQLKTIAISTFLLGSGEWSFVKKVPEVPNDLIFSIELPSIIIEGINKNSNISYFRNKFNSHLLHVEPLNKYIENFLSSDQISFYEQLSNLKNISNEQIISKLKLSNESFWKNVSIFYLLSIIDFIETPVDKELSRNIEEIIEKYDNLKYKRINYYELLGLKNTATLDEIKETYFNFAKKYHPDRISLAPDPEIEEKANFVFAEINKAYEVLSNDEKKKEYDTKGYRENVQADLIEKNLVERARVLYKKAKALHAQKKYWEASSLLDEAVKLDNQRPSYFLLLGQCQVNLPSLRRMAEKNLQRVIEIEPWNAEAFFTMGTLFISENLKKRAEGFLRKAVSINPDHILAKKKLEEVLEYPSKKKKSVFSIFRKQKK